MASLALAQSPPAADTGKKIFESQCALCHGQNGGGGRGPSLLRPKLDKAPDEAALRGVIENGIPPEMPGAWQLHPREVAALAGYVKALGAQPVEAIPGDPARGVQVYQRSGCPGCHIVDGQGEGLGPELSTIGSRRNAAYLRSTVLRPADGLPDNFHYVSIQLSKGSAIKGIRVNEDSFTIQIKDARGLFHSFEKSDIKELKPLPKETPMPSYEKTLSASDLDDLVAYLAARRVK